MDGGKGDVAGRDGRLRAGRAEKGQIPFEAAVEGMMRRVDELRSWPIEKRAEMHGAGAVGDPVGIRSTVKAMPAGCRRATPGAALLAAPDGVTRTLIPATGSSQRQHGHLVVEAAVDRVEHHLAVHDVAA